MSRNPRNLSPESSSLVSTSFTHSGNDEDFGDSGIISLFFFAGTSGIFPQNPAPKRLHPALRPSEASQTASQNFILPGLCRPVFRCWRALANRGGSASKRRGWCNVRREAQGEAQWLHRGGAGVAQGWRSSGVRRRGGAGGWHTPGAGSGAGGGAGVTQV